MTQQRTLFLKAFVEGLTEELDKMLEEDEVMILIIKDSEGRVIGGIGCRACVVETARDFAEENKEVKHLERKVAFKTTHTPVH